MKNADFQIWSFLAKNSGPTPLKKVHFFTKGGAVFMIEGRLNVKFFCSDLMC